MKNILLLLLLCMSSQMLLGQRQSYQGYIYAGDEAVARNDYYSAYKYYGVALEYPGKENEPEALYKVGMTAVKTRAYAVGRDALLRLGADAATYPDHSYFLGEAYYRMGDYDQAVIQFEKFLTDNPSADEAMRLEVANHIENANWAILESSNERDIVLTNLPPNVNSEYSDVAFTVSPGGAEYFTSNRFKFEKDTLNPRRKLSRIMRREDANVGVELPKSINTPGKLVAHSSFNTAGNRVYYSVCQYYDEVNIRCALYRADVDGSGDWSNPQPLSLNVDGYTSQMPNVGLDRKTAKEYLYFSSNREGGSGKMDLYRAEINEDGTVGTAMNLEEVNTPGNDVTPFYYGPRGTLYFSSDRQPTFGGLDVFKSYSNDQGFSAPVNLGMPLNSSYDDAYYARYENREMAYLSSTRQSPDAIFFDEEKEVCCYDIYQFNPDDGIDLLLNTFNWVNKKQLVPDKIILCKLDEKDNPIFVDSIVNPIGNEFRFKVDPGGKYKLVSTKEGFSPVTNVFVATMPYDGTDDSDGVRSVFDGSNGMIEIDFYHAPKVDLEVETFNSNDGTPLPGATVGLYHVDENGKETLLQELTNATANDFTFPLEYGNRYIIKGARPGFAVQTDEIDLRNVEPDGTKVIKRRLDFGQLLEVLVIDAITLEPLLNATVTLGQANGPEIAKRTNPNGNDFNFTINLNKNFTTLTERDGYYSSIDTLFFTKADLEAGNGKLQFIIPLFPSNIDKLLPLKVFFDNDHPNPRTTSRTTRLSYQATYEPYYNRRDEFTKEFTEGMGQDDEYLTRQLFKNFFDRQVKGGWDQLEAFAKQLETHLANGNSIDLKIQGFASPRAATDYNMRLSSRRIESVINYFNTCNDSALKQYIRSGQLTFTKDVKGEVADPKEVSDRLDDPRQSVFSLVASLERKVEVSNNSKQ